MDARSHRCQDIVDEGAAAELAEATVQGAHREVFRLTQEMAEATSHWFQRPMLQPSMVGNVVSA